MKERMTEEKALLLIAGVDAALKKCDFNYEDKATYQLLQRGDTEGFSFWRVLLISLTYAN